MNVTMRMKQRKRLANGGKIELKNRLVPLKNKQKKLVEVMVARKNRRKASLSKREEKMKKIAVDLNPRKDEDDIQGTVKESRRRIICRQKEEQMRGNLRFTPTSGRGGSMCWGISY